MLKLYNLSKILEMGVEARMHAIVISIKELNEEIENNLEILASEIKYNLVNIENYIAMQNFQNKIHNRNIELRTAIQALESKLLEIQEELIEQKQQTSQYEILVKIEIKSKKKRKNAREQESLDQRASLILIQNKMEKI